MSRQGEERLQQHLAQGKAAPKAPISANTSRLVKKELKPEKPSCPPAPKSSKSSQKPERCRRGKGALDKGQPQLGQEGAELPRGVSRDADSKKPDLVAASTSRAAFEQQRPREAQLEEMAKAVVWDVLERVKAPWNLLGYVLRRAAVAIRWGLCGRAGGAEPSQTSHADGRQAIGGVARELVATVLDSLGKYLASSMFPGARQKEQPVARGGTQAGKSKEGKWGQAEPAASDRASSQASLDTLTREVVENVCCALDSFLASQLEWDSSCVTYCEILELPRGSLFSRQVQPSQVPFSRQEGRGFPRASEEQGREASKGVKLPVLRQQPSAGAAHVSQLRPRDARESLPSAVSRVQQRPAARTGQARAFLPEIPGAAEAKSEGGRQPKPAAASDQGSPLRTMARWIVEYTLKRICQPGPPPTPKEPSGRPVPRAPTPWNRQERRDTETSLLSMCPGFSRQPVPPAAPKPPAQAGARRRGLLP